MFNPHDPNVSRSTHGSPAASPVPFSSPIQAHPSTAPGAAEPIDPDDRPWLVRKGDRIRLRSGGADMSCERVNYGGTPPFAQCVWQDERRKLHRAYINLDALSRVFTEE